MSEPRRGGRGALIVAATCLAVSFLLNFTLPVLDRLRMTFNLAAVPDGIYQLLHYIQALTGSAIIPFLAVWWWFSHVSRDVPAAHGNKSRNLRRGARVALILGVASIVISIALQFVLSALITGRSAGPVNDWIPAWAFQLLAWLQFLGLLAAAPSFAAWWGFSQATKRGNGTVRELG